MSFNDIDDWSSSLVLKSVPYSEDDLDEEALNDYRDWEKDFSDDERTEVASDWDWGETDSDLSEFTTETEKKTLAPDDHQTDKNNERSLMEFLPHLHPKLHNTNSPNLVEFRTKYEFGSSIEPFCINISAAETKLGDNGAKVSQLLCDEIDAVKMAIEMLQGYQNDIYLVSKEMKSHSVHSSMISGVFPSLRKKYSREISDNAQIVVPEGSISLTPLALTLKTDTLSAPMLTNILTKISEIGSQLLYCREFISHYEEFFATLPGDDVVQSVVSSQHASILYMLRLVDAELAKIELHCLNKMAAQEIPISACWDDDVRNCRLAQAQEYALFPLDIHKFGDDKVHTVASGGSGGGRDTPLSLFRLWIVCQGWESMLQQAVALTDALYGFKVITSLNNCATALIGDSSNISSATGTKSLRLHDSGDDSDLLSVKLLCHRSYAAYLLGRLHTVDKISSLIDTNSNSKWGSSGYVHCRRRDSSMLCSQRRFMSNIEQSNSLVIKLAGPSRPLSILFFQIAYTELVTAFLSSLVKGMAAYKPSNMAVVEGSQWIELLPPPLRTIAEALQEASFDLNIMASVKKRSNGIVEGVGADISAVAQNALRRFSKAVIDGVTPSKVEARSALVLYCAVPETLAWLNAAYDDAMLHLFGNESGSGAVTNNSRWRPHVGYFTQYDSNSNRCILGTAACCLEEQLMWNTEPVVEVQRTTIRCSTQNDRPTTALSECDKLDVVLKPLSDLMLLTDARGILKSLGERAEPNDRAISESSPAEENQVSIGDRILAPSSLAQAIELVAGESTLSTTATASKTISVESDQDDFDEFESSRAQPVSMRDTGLLSSPILAALGQVQSKTTELLLRSTPSATEGHSELRSIGFDLKGHLDLLFNVFLLREPEIFQHLRHMVADDTVSEIMWKSAQTGSLSTEIDATEVDIQGSGNTPAMRKHSYALWGMCQSIRTAVESYLPPKEYSAVTHTGVTIDADDNAANASASVVQGMPLIYSVVSHFKVDFVLTWPMAAIIPVTHLSTFNKGLQFLLPLLMLKWSGEHLWKKCMTTTYRKSSRATSTPSPVAGKEKDGSTGRPRRSLGSASNSPSARSAAGSLSATSPTAKSSAPPLTEAQLQERAVNETRRQVCLGLHLITQVVKTLFAHYMTTLHEAIVAPWEEQIMAQQQQQQQQSRTTKTGGGGSTSDSWSCAKFQLKQAEIVAAVAAVIQVMHDPICHLVQRGFACIAVINDATVFQGDVTAESIGPNAYLARLRNEAAHLRRAYTAISSFRIGLQQLQVSLKALSRQSRRGRIDGGVIGDIKARFVEELEEKLSNVPT